MKRRDMANVISMNTVKRMRKEKVFMVSQNTVNQGFH